MGVESGIFLEEMGKSGHIYRIQQYDNILESGI